MLRLSKKYPQYFHLHKSEVRLAGKDFPDAKETVPPTSIAESEVTTAGKNDEWEKVESQLMAEENFVSSVETIQQASEKSGIYCIRIKDIQRLPPPCQEALAERKHNILYIGIATNLQRRLQQELEAIGHGTFFRSLGAILGFTPPQGSLTGKKNKKNYTFSPDDERKIIQFIRENLLINHVETSTRDEELETRLIGKYQPVINIDKNPGKLPFVQEKRKDCVNIANRK